ncbi:hypothetical protein [Novosphingobium rhizosphaerae]|uniref:hypothetical protein n=1 Tax=Novosphingobium rhizosphaerae TaxID=1551649 RepID=UPI003D81530B
MNSYDNAHLSVGICQWTAGADGAPGELAVLLRRIHAADPATYDDCFGRYGLVPAQMAGEAAGLLTLGGQTLDTGDKKRVLRSPEWAWRFWRAGHHPSVRLAQAVLAADRTKHFLDREIAGHRVADWLSSELGVALLLDEHVNRPGHVPGTLAQAINQLSADQRDCTAWQPAQERALVDAYLAQRATTTMTHAKERGEAILVLARAGKLSDQRGSFSRDN